MTSELTTSPSLEPERLFGAVAASGLSRHAAFLERATSEAERDNLASRVALAAYLTARLVDTHLRASEVDGGSDGLLWQRNAVARHLQELPSELPEVSHLVGVVDAVSLESASLAMLRVSLIAYAYFLEHEGRYGESLEIVALGARTHGSVMPPGDFAVCALLGARLNRLLARWDEALVLYAAAESVSQRTGDHVARLRGRLGQGSVCRGKGDLPKARAIAEQVLAEAADLDLVEVQLIAYGDLSSVCGMQGDVVAALQADYNAFLLAPDAMSRMRALGDLGVGFLEIGAHEAARLAFEIVLKSGASFWVRYNALLELMDLESLIGNRVAFERLRLEAEAGRDRMSPSMVADYLRKVGIGFGRFSQVSRGREVLESALAYAEGHRLNTWYFKIEAALQDLERISEKESAAESFVPVEPTPIVREMEAGLREYAALQPA